ncbi:MAG: cupin domain-containing protein [Woeseiaceae bacterium]|nr:cupin domain-containing protein [Woeseiaceae bacterium]
MDVNDILSELAAVPEGTFLDVVRFNDHHIGACSITGVSPVWEMHPDTDEFFFIIEGIFEVTVLTETGVEHRLAPAGSTLVIPRGLWHKPAAPQGAKFLYLTPGQSLHSEAEDPRETAT